MLIKSKCWAFPCKSGYFYILSFNIMVKPNKKLLKQNKTNNDQVMAIQNKTIKISKPTTVGKGIKSAKVVNIKPNGIVEDAFKIGNTALNVLQTGSKLVSEPFDLSNWQKELPSTISKVVSTVQDFTGGQPHNKVILDGTVSTKSDQALLDKVKKDALVINSNAIPVSYASTFTKPDSSMYQTSKVGDFQTFVMKNTSVIKEVYFPSASFVNTVVADYETSLFAYGNFGSRIDNFVKLFDRFRIKSLTYQYTPNCGTSTIGSFHMMYRRAPKKFTDVNGYMLLSDASQLEKYSEGSIYAGQSLTIPIESDWLYCGDVTSTDVKWYANGRVMFGTNGSNSGIYPNKCGTLYVTVAVECYGAIPPTLFPSLLPGPALTRMLGMSVYQYTGLWKSDDIRNIVQWTNHFLQQSLRKVELDFINLYSNIDEYFTEEEKLESWFSKARQLRKLSLTRLNSRELISSKGKNHNLRLKPLSLDDEISEDFIFLATQVIEQLYKDCKARIEEFFFSQDNTRRRAGDIIRSFVREFLNWNLLSTTFIPWAETILNYLPTQQDVNNELLEGNTSMFNFLKVILNDIKSLFSIDLELKFDPELDFNEEILEQGTVRISSLDEEKVTFKKKASESTMKIEQLDIHDDYIVAKYDDFGLRTSHTIHDVGNHQSDPLLHCYKLRTSEKVSDFLKTQYSFDETKIGRILSFLRMNVLGEQYMEDGLEYFFSESHRDQLNKYFSKIYFGKE